ncbi:MAG: hypothetical protein ACLPN6_15265 [Streptosporangiaceae bacterium]|jgi:hypothetical protein
MEKGSLPRTGVSDSVLGSLARALQLDEAERAPVRPGPRRGHR